MAKYTGDDLGVTYNTTTLTANLVRTVTLNESAEVHESTGASDDNKTYLGGNKDATVSIELWDDSTATTVWNVFAPGTSSTLDVYPQGNTSGKPKRSMTAIVTGRSQGIDHNGVVPISVGLQVSGAITESTVST